MIVVPLYLLCGLLVALAARLEQGAPIPGRWWGYSLVAWPLILALYLSVIALLALRLLARLIG